MKIACPIYGKAHGIMQINQNKWNCLGILDTNWQQFFIYFNFNCTIAWILTYLVLLDPKDQMITFKKQKYLNKWMPVVPPVM